MILSFKCFNRNIAPGINPLGRAALKYDYSTEADLSKSMLVKTVNIPWFYSNLEKRVDQYVKSIYVFNTTNFYNKRGWKAYINLFLPTFMLFKMVVTIEFWKKEKSNTVNVEYDIEINIPNI